MTNIETDADQMRTKVGTPPRRGTKNYALAAAKACSEPRPSMPSKKLQERERAVALVKARLDLLLSKLPPTPKPRKIAPVTVKVVPVVGANLLRQKRYQWLRTHCETQGERCAYCQRSMNRYDRSIGGALKPSLDHVIPLSKGGADSFENTVAACRQCNGEKGAMMPEEYRAIWQERRARLPATPA